MQLGLFVDRESLDLFGVERMVPRQVGPICHAFDTGFGHVDGLEPDADLIRAEAAEPLARRAPMPRSPHGIWFRVRRVSARMLESVVCFVAACPHVGRYQALVEIAFASGRRLAGLLMDWRRDAGEIPAAVDKTLALIPAPTSVLGGSP